MRLFSTATSPLLALFALAACGSNGTVQDAGVDDAGIHDAGSNDAGNNDAGNSDAGNNDAGTSDAGSDAGTGSCAAPGYSPAVHTFNPTPVTATLHDLSESPLSGIFVSVSGLDISYPGTTASNGGVTINASQMFKNPAFVMGDGLNYGHFVVPLDGTNSALGTLHLPALPANGAALTPGQSATSGGLTLTLAANAVINFDTLVYSTSAQQQLRAAEVPIAQAPVPASAGLERVFAVAPVETIVCPPAKASIPNTANWPAGTAVDFYILGDDTGQSWAPYGGWAKVSSGKVSSDGATIQTNDGEGLPLLSSLGIKRH